MKTCFMAYHEWTLTVWKDESESIVGEMQSIRQKIYCTIKNNDKTWSKIKVQCDIYQSDSLSLLQFVIVLFELDVMK